MSSYARLEQKFSDIARLREIQAISGWDEACMMPSGAGETRSQALATLTTLIHERLCDPEIGELVNRARGEAELDGWAAANLASIEREFVLATAIPSDLAHASALEALRCEQAWRAARANDDWPSVRPLLERVVSLARDQAAALADALDLEPYDALLETYESELRVNDIEPIFADLAAYLPTVIDQVLGRQPEPLPLAGPFPVEAQRRLCERVMGELGFDFDRGRFDVSHHPFCGGVPDDTRITTRYREDSFLESLMAICHETGHALYQQGLPSAWREQPVGAAMGAAVHESQSLFMELQVCRGQAFVGHLAPAIREQFGQSASDPAWSADNLYRHATRVARGYIRVDADEVTYPLHVILRFELERALLDGSLAVADLPDAWDAAMQRHLGLTTAGNDPDGCMQDVHWYAGLFGYFPTYTLGALGAAQWFDAAQSAIPDLEAKIGRGELADLVSWLRTNVHEQGARTTLQPLFESVTGERLGTAAYRRHVEARYLA